MMLAIFPIQSAMNNPPASIKEEILKKHVIYLHGAIIERGDPKPIHPRFGLYDYPAIVEALSTDDVVLIAEQRKPKTNPEAYAKLVVSQINTLITKGVIPSNITIVGFSKGAGITVRTSSLLANSAVNFVIMAGCGPWYETRPKLKELQLKGHILSIYEVSDRPGSCQKLVDRSPQITSFKEVALNTGKEHGAFFIPRKEWLEPVLAWIRR